jgi:hypothetical protein
MHLDVVVTHYATKINANHAALGVVLNFYGFDFAYAFGEHGVHIFPELAHSYGTIAPFY